MEENEEDYSGLKLVTPLKNPCLFTCQMQCSQEQNNCCPNEPGVTHAGLTETEIFPVGHGCFPSQQVMNLKENS